MKSISVLMGAGFSAPIGYPIGNILNNELIEITKNKFVFDGTGNLFSVVGDTKPDLNGHVYDNQFVYCIELIAHFNKKQGGFDYERFYDYILEEALEDIEAKELANPFLYNTDFNQLIGGLKHIFQQLVAHFLKDSEGNTWYDNLPSTTDGRLARYNGFLTCMNELAKQNVINFHTLNHDMFFESLGKRGFLEGGISDGFEENGSPYYGRLKVDNRSYLCRLERYKGIYNKNFRLFKLHGSLDYSLYYRSRKAILTPKVYIKTRYGINLTDLYCEKTHYSGRAKYENCWINYHADFLTGTTSKIERYKEPLLYNILFDKFRQNLRDSEKLIIIGFGSNDKEVKNIIERNFNFSKRKVIIINPSPSPSVIELAQKLNAKMLGPDRNLENITLSDLE